MGRRHQIDLDPGPLLQSREHELPVERLQLQRVFRAADDDDFQVIQGGPDRNFPEYDSGHLLPSLGNWPE